MNIKNLCSFKFPLAVFTVVLLLCRNAKAGLPLVCHPFDIADAKSLPWATDTWNLSGREDYDLNRLVQDTLALLSPAAPVIVRMETLRRAMLYAQKDHQVAKELLARLKARALDGEAKGRPEAMAWFDFGYLVESYKQANVDYKQLPSGSWQTVFKPNAATGLDGFAWVVKAISLRGNDPEMEFAAALITTMDHQERHKEYLQKAVSGAKEGSLLAKNLVLHFGDPGSTLAALRAQVAPGKN